MKQLARVPVFAVLALLSGCYVANTLELEGLKPAEVIISPSIQSLTVVSKCDLDSLNFAHLESKGRELSFKHDSLMSKQVVLGCSDALVESPRFQLFNPIVRRTYIENLPAFSNELPLSKVVEIAGNPPKDAVLSLERAFASDTIEGINQEGWMVYRYLVFVKTQWKLYRLNDFQSNEFVFIDTVSFDLSSSTQFIASPNQKLEFIYEAMYEAGMKSAKRIAPWWTVLKRYFFAVGPSEFLRGSVLLRKGNWSEAAEVWRRFTESKQSKTAAKACYNMAVTCEMANSIPAAYSWLKQSEKNGMPAFYIDEYMSKLAIRQLETAKLDEQLR